MLKLYECITFSFRRSGLFFPHSNYSILNSQCWNCNKFNRAKNKFCESCHVIQPLNSKENYFSYFRVKPKFVIDVLELKNSFRRMQSLLHPDKFARSNDNEKSFSQQHSTYLNKAYATLRDPLARANYLLKIFDKENTEKNEEIDQAYILEIMKLNEKIDSTENENELEKILENVNQQIQSYLIDIEESFLQNDLSNSKRLLNKMNYLERTTQLLNRKLGRFF